MKRISEIQSTVPQSTLTPMIWLNHPDKFEAEGIKYTVKAISISKITEVAWTVTKTRKQMEACFRKGEKLPLILVERKKNTYELHDGQHRFAAYCNVFSEQKTIKVASFYRGL